MTGAPLPVANAAAAAARRLRASALLAVTRGSHSIIDVITASCTEQGRPLLRLTVRQLLLAQPGWGTARATKVIEHIVTLLGIRDLRRRDITIAWLVDPRAGGRRIMCFADAIHSKTNPPWPGFPFATKPGVAR